MAGQRDLFDDTTMTFGEHLEVLRIHLLRAIIGLGICVVIALCFGGPIVGVIRRPIDAALQRHGRADAVDDVASEKPFMEMVQDYFSAAEEPKEEEVTSDSMYVTIRRRDLIEVLTQVDPEFVPPAAEDDPAPVNDDDDDVEVDTDDTPDETSPDGSDETTNAVDSDDTETDESGSDDVVKIRVSAPELADMRLMQKRANQPVSLRVEEAFMTFLKVSFVAGFVLASPWVFFQVWQFVAAGLYKHERKYVYTFLPVSLGLFFSGAAFCFFLVFPFVLDFMLSFNTFLGVHPQIRLSEWVSFAVTLPLLFGLSFQLPLVMLFMERIGIFDVDAYRSSRRMAILVIAVTSMIMTPQDPTSMLLMMLPLTGLYEVGIWMCRLKPLKKSPFAEAS